MTHAEDDEVMIGFKLVANEDYRTWKLVISSKEPMLLEEVMEYIQAFLEDDAKNPGSELSQGSH